MSPVRSILVLGAGELGTAIVRALLDHSSYDAKQVTLTVMVRPPTVASLESDDQSPRIRDLRVLQSRGVSFVAADIVEDTQETLSNLFRQSACVIHAGAMTLPEGTQLKVTRAAIAAEVHEYVPWQWGVDYDVIGRDGGLGLFREQLDVRDALRAQSRTKWFILSCGVFMSFLFEEFWGVVTRDKAGKVNGIRALGGWDHLITATTAEDIAKANAELVLVDSDQRDKAVYIAGDSIRYDEFADLVENAVGRKLSRDVWTTEWLIQQSKVEPDNKIWKYRVVFSEDKGLAWPKQGTYNDTKEMDMECVEAYVKRTGLE